MRESSKFLGGGSKIVAAFLACAVLSQGMLTGWAARAEAAVLVEDGQNRATVVLPEGANSQTRQAVEDLLDYMERISGVRPQLASSGDEVSTPVTVWVAMHEGVEERFADIDVELEQWEEILLACRGDHVLIAGRDAEPGGSIQQAGTSLAVYEFMERYLGVRWLWPGPLGEVVPERDTIELDEFTYRHTPPRQRGLRVRNHLGARATRDFPWTHEEKLPSLEEFQAIAQRLDDGAMQWSQRQRGNARAYYRMMRAGHAFTDWYDEYGQEHPEYFALQPDGTREPYPRPTRVKMCVSNPGLAERWLERAETYFGRQPATLVKSASPNDSAFVGVCVCAECRAWDVEGGPTYEFRWDGRREAHPAITDRQVKFWNILARGLRERFPDRETFVGVWAYGPYRTPPVERQLEDNIMVGFVGPIPADHEAGRAKDLEHWKQWSDKTEHLFWRPNLFHRQWQTPVLFPRRAGEDFATMADHGLVGIDVDSVHNHWATQGLQYYVLAQLAWDPYRDVEELIEDYVVSAFGQEAAAPMRAYYDRLEERYYELAEHIAGMHYRDAVLHYPEFYNESFLNELETLIAQARDAIEDARHLERLDFVETGLQFTRAQMNAIDAMTHLRRGGRDDVIERLERAIEATDERDRLLIENLETYALNASEGLSREHFGMSRSDQYLGPVAEEYRVFLEADDERRLVLPAQWQFQLDPDEQGREEGWYDAPRFDRVEWDTIQVTSPWGEQLRTDDPYEPEPLEYHGVAWYRTSFELDEQPRADEKIWLQFGAVDESCWIYVNGEKVAGQVYDPDYDPDAWRKPRRFEITDHVKAGKNDLVVRVQALAGQGGITRPVHVERLPAELMPNSSLRKGFEDWRVGLYEQEHDELDDRVSTAFDLSRYVGEQSKRIEIEPREGDDANFPYANLRQDSDAPLEAGRAYEVRVRYQQQFDVPEDEIESPMRIRLYAYGDFEDEGRDRLWFETRSRNVHAWEEVSSVFTAPRDYDRSSVTIFFRYPGIYKIDEVSLRPVNFQGH